MANLPNTVSAAKSHLRRKRLDFIITLVIIIIIIVIIIIVAASAYLHILHHPLTLCRARGQVARNKLRIRILERIKVSLLAISMRLNYEKAIKKIKTYRGALKIIRALELNINTLELL